VLQLKKLAMTFIPNDKIFSLKWFRDYSMIVIGAFILAVGFVYFISPHRIVPGGVYGIAIVVHYMTAGMFSFWPEGFPIGLFGLILNVPLTIAGIKIRSEEHTSELQSRSDLVCRLLLEKKKK